MPTNREKMVELMQRLQDLYQQVENVHLDYSREIVEEHIHGLEVKLTEYLMFSCNDYNWRTQVQLFYRSTEAIHDVDIDINPLKWNMVDIPLPDKAVVICGGVDLSPEDED